MTWPEILPVATLLAALVFFPGFVCLRLFGIRGVLAAGAAPAVSVGILGSATIALGLAGIPWRPWPVVLWVGTCVGAAVAATRLQRPGGIHSLPVSGRGAAVALGVATVLGLAIQAVPFTRGAGSPDAVPQMHDSLFHLNGVALIDRTGNASLFGGLAPMYGDGGSGIYPSVWHALVVLGLPMASIEVSTNAALIVAVMAPWLLGILALGRVAFPQRPAVAASAVLLAGSFPVFPTIAVVFKGMYPYGVSVALVPGTVALFVFALQHAGERPRALLLGATLIAGSGVVLAHPSGAAALMLLCATVLVQHAWAWGTDLRRCGHKLGGVVIFAVPWLLIGVLTFAIVRLPLLRHMAAISSPSKDWAAASLQGLLSIREGEVPRTVNVAVTVLVVIGLTVTLATASTRWLAMTWLLTFAALVIAAGPESHLRSLTGFWYKSPDRVESLLVAISSLLAACGAVTVASATTTIIRRGLPLSSIRVHRSAVMMSALVIIVVVSYVTSDGYRHAERELRAARAYDTTRMVHPPWATEDELDWIRLLRPLLPDDAVVLGDPRNGAAFVQLLAGRQAAVPALGPGVPSRAEEYLLARFRDIRTDPKVCAALAAEGIEYYYEDKDMIYGPEPVSAARPGLYGVDTEWGFELVSARGTSRLYRITACHSSAGTDAGGR